MSDPRFASFKTDPRFRRPKRHNAKIVLDDRFKDLLGNEKKGKKKKSSTKQDSAKVDKYGRTVSDTREKDDLRRFYRLEEDEGEQHRAAGIDGTGPSTVIDYARGVVLMESSDEEEEEEASHRISDEDDSESDEGGFVSLGVETSRRKKVGDEDDLEIDLDEHTVADLDAQVAAYVKAVPERHTARDVEQTRRIAVVNLDWDYVRAAHLYKIFSSLVSPTAPLASVSTAQADNEAASGGVNVVRGRILSVRIYPSEFGKKRMAKEEKEGPPTELFKTKKNDAEEEEINEKTIFDTGTEGDYDEDALRTYQLERLRYFYGIVECDTVEAAVHVYNELEGTELERSANVFDLSFVPDEMTFDDETRDEVTELSNTPYRAVEFVTDALRHSKVKLTWDEDDPERNQILRRPLTKKEIEEADFRAYIASSESDTDGEQEDAGVGHGKEATGRRKQNGAAGKRSNKAAERDKLRMLLLGGNDEDMPEGWGDAFNNKASRGGKGKKGAVGGEEDSDVDMEITFMPGLSETKNPEDENTLERYQRKMKEKRKKRKDEAKAGVGADDEGEGKGGRKGSAGSTYDDDFFGAESGSEREEPPSTRRGEKSAKTKKSVAPPTSKAELALLVSSDNPHGEPAHFDMKAILKAEKQSKSKKSRHKKKRGGDDADEGPNETQEGFVVDVKDDRFAALHEDHQFAIDPSNPHFKKTKSMAALLEERSKRQKSDSRSERAAQSHPPASQAVRSLQSLVESVKRKSLAVEQGGMGKRRKLSESS